MSSHGIIPNILRAMLFAGICSIVFMVLSIMASYSIDSTDIYTATLQERLSDTISHTNFDSIHDISLDPIISSMSDPQTQSRLGIRIKIDGITDPLYFNKKFFDAYYGSGAAVRSNVRSKTVHRLLTTLDGQSILVTIDSVGSRI